MNQPAGGTGGFGPKGAAPFNRKKLKELLRVLQELLGEIAEALDEDEGDEE